MHNYYSMAYDIDIYQQYRLHPIYCYFKTPRATVNLHNIMRRKTKPHMMVYDFDFTSKFKTNVQKTHQFIEIVYTD